MITIEKYFKDFEEGLWKNPRKSSLEWQYIQANLHPLEKFNKKDVLIYLFNKMNHSFNMPFLLCAPSLWCDTSVNDWQYIFNNVKRQKNHRFLIDDSHCFDDVFFLCRYVQVDALNFVFKSSLIIDSDKLAIFKYFKIAVNELFMDEFDTENIEDGTWASKIKFNKLKNTLLIGGFCPAIHSVNKIESNLNFYIGELTR